MSICREKQIECLYFGVCIHCKNYKSCADKRGSHKNCFNCKLEGKGKYDIDIACSTDNTPSIEEFLAEDKKSNERIKQIVEQLEQINACKYNDGCDYLRDCERTGY